MGRALLAQQDTQLILTFWSLRMCKGSQGTRG